MMYYHLSPHIYITQFREEFILLDTINDKYTICFEQFSEIFKSIIEYKPYNHSLENSKYIENLLNDQVIVKRHSPYPFSIDRKRYSQGASNVDWRLPLDNKKMSLNFNVVIAYITLIKVNYYIKHKGLYNSIKKIKNSRKSIENYIVPQEEELKKLANIVNKACLLYPSRIKCLEWAMTFVLLALKRNWKCNLEIGVQNYPFFAHAWVECDGKVVMDSQENREGLAIILNEPFRKEKL